METTTNTADASGYHETGNEYTDDSTAIAHVINPDIAVDKTVDFDDTPGFSKEETKVSNIFTG